MNVRGSSLILRGAIACAVEDSLPLNRAVGPEEAG